ncbi:hypothetical protein D3C75_829900 [compost metagenome]
MLHEHPDLGVLGQTVRQIGGGAARSHCAIFLGIAHHADCQVHLFLHLALGGGDGVEARGQRAQQFDKLIRAQGGGEALEHIHHLGAGHQGVDLGLVAGQILERRIARYVSESCDKAAVQAGQLEVAGQGRAQGALCGGFIAGEAGQGQYFAHQIGVIVEPDAEGITRLISDAGLFQVDLDVADVLGGVAAGDLLIDRQAGREGVLLVILAVADGLLHRTRYAGGRGPCGQGGGDGIDCLLAPGLGRVLIVHVQAREFMNALGTRF